MKVQIQNLKFKAIIGILDFEREKAQRVIINSTFEYDFKKENNKFIDYSIVANIIKKTMKKKKFLLIEDAILFLHNKLNKKFGKSGMRNLSLKITKPDILDDCIVSVEE